MTLQILKAVGGTLMVVGLVVGLVGVLLVLSKITLGADTTNAFLLTISAVVMIGLGAAFSALARIAHAVEAKIE